MPPPPGLPVGSLLDPKVFVPHRQKPGATPRRVAVQRKKKLFAAQDIAALLAEHGGGEAVRAEARLAALDAGKGSLVQELPLSAFDNTEFEMYAPEQWIRRGRGGAAGGPASLPARGLCELDGNSVWSKCTVSACERGAQGQYLFRARWAHTGAVVKLGRLEVCFDAEDPVNFAKRVAAAHQARLNAEAVIRFNLYVDSMPTDDVGGLDSEQVNRVLTLALSSECLRMNDFDTSQLLNEVNMDFAR